MYQATARIEFAADATTRVTIARGERVSPALAALVPDALRGALVPDSPPAARASPSSGEEDETPASAPARTTTRRSRG